MNAAPKPIEGVECEFRGRVAIITINRTKKLGALAQEHYFNIARWMRHIDSREDVFITVLTGTGRFFSAGADVTVSGKDTGAKDDQFRINLQNFAAYNLNITHAFYTHSKILVTALNGPVVGLSAALIGHSDFVYAAPHAYLLCPFTSLGLVAEGLASRAMNSRLGPARGAEALLMSKRITCPELLQCGFVNKVFETKPEEHEKFLGLVLEEVDNRLGEHLVPNSLIKIKEMMRGPEREQYDAQGVKEVMGGLDVFMRGIPQEEFRKIASGEKRHKL
ncbi:related to peroxisomal D3,D2-enoyl-CoA isomerase [Ramularia collo-cygni]|uniref:Related to peroxisomal D3,D2-enoyl-CoA isomerase n=1 Tax=Ramularia collo-cygni TaxID=112498 RepID=A0A2D3VDX1_9PEZI|nr:related to peroxisomal D3,D2-enoyl-CoA isomerase [Ramularia collo-cygni]CZT18793.1 related to peroxisomal D3,D2-enoyl-CoA isomerase [Ramularia collo-cygni]